MSASLPYPITEELPVIHQLFAARFHQPGGASMP